MKLSAQEEFGLRCMVALAREGDEGFLTIPAIAKSEGLTQSHVAKLLAILRRAGFVNSQRGQLGGYSLTRPAREIKVSTILEALGGRLCTDHFCDRFAGQKPECVHSTDCTLLPMWARIQQAVDSALDSMTLEDLADPDTGVNVKMYDDPALRATVGA